MQLSRSLFAAGLIAVIGMTAFGLSRQNAYAASISSGDLVRGTTYSAVYYMGRDGFRYVFPNQKTYDTWYPDFSTVKFVSDAELSKIQIGGNVTYKPGARMIKIDSDPRTYAVDAHGVLRHVSSESLAVSLYGATWNKQIDDMPDGFFTNYTIGDALVSPGDYSAADAKNDAVSINEDKHLQAPKLISITSSGFSPIEVTIEEGQGVKFTNNDTTKHTATADNLTWGTGTLNPGESFIKMFSERATYTFFDSYDSSNTGTVYVEIP